MEFDYLKPTGSYSSCSFCEDPIVLFEGLRPQRYCVSCMNKMLILGVNFDDIFEGEIDEEA